MNKNPPAWGARYVEEIVQVTLLKLDSKRKELTTLWDKTRGCEAQPAGRFQSGFSITMNSGFS